MYTTTWILPQMMNQVRLILREEGPNYIAALFASLPLSFPCLTPGAHEQEEQGKHVLGSYLLNLASYSNAVMAFQLKALAVNMIVMKVYGCHTNQLHNLGPGSCQTNNNIYAYNYI